MTPSIYKSYDLDQLDELLSGFLVSTWSYSKVQSFARNEKAFEMQSIFGLYAKKSATTVAGQAYHEALQYYWENKQAGKTLDLVELEAAAFAYIDQLPGNQWKIQKTTPTVEDCQKKAYTTVSALLRNFYGELSVYEADLKEILGVEISGTEFLTINGVDIPLPCSFKIDLAIRTKDDKVIIIDHKSKNVYTDDEEVALSIGEQAITYVKAFEEKTGLTVDEVWFVENKYSKNKDGGAQLNCFKVQIDDNTRRLYEALLYEPLKRMVEAVSNPDYTYLINPSDNYVDRAELYDFWCRTMICEVEDFNVEESKKELVSKRLKKIRDASIQTVSPSVIKNFKENASQFIQYDLSNKDMTNQQKIEHVLRSFGTIVRVAHTFEGYSSVSYLLEVSAGVKITSLYSRRLDIANALDVEDVRISSKLVVYEGKSYISVEHKIKRVRDLVHDASILKGRKIPIGVDNYGGLVYWDLDNQSTPHALICGTTGSGKSVCLISMLEHILQTDVDNVIILDPKREFIKYDSIGDGRISVVNEIIDIETELKKLVDYMNRLIKEGRERRTVIIFDEVADAFLNARSGAELKIYEQKFDGYYANGNAKSKRVHTGDLPSIQDNFQSILQKGRSSGFRMLAALQRADTSVINGNSKNNFPVRICFQVQKEVDSMVILDEPGANKLAGKGDGLIQSTEFNDTVRFQAFYKPDQKLETA